MPANEMPSPTNIVDVDEDKKMAIETPPSVKTHDAGDDGDICHEAP